MPNRLSVLVSAFTLFFVSLAGEASAAGRSQPWQMWLQEAGSPTMERITAFNEMLLGIEIAIVLFVLAIMVFIVIRFNEKANPVPSKTTHNTVLEVIWTAIPIIILVIIAIPSMKLLYYADHTQEADMTLKVTGHQWYWTYTYPDHGDLEFDSNIIPDDELKEGQPRLLSVDNRVVLPVGATVRLLLNSDDVIHNWAVPSLGIKLDTTPGRTNETWVRINKPGMYYGMCSELCGVNHGFMPIQIEAVAKEAFQAWVAKAKKEFAKNEEDGSLRVAQAAAAGK